MTSPIDSGDPLAAIAAQQAALAAATWTPLAAVPGVDTAPVGGLVAARKHGGTRPVLWLDSDDFADLQAGDPDIKATLTALVG